MDRAARVAHVVEREAREREVERRRLERQRKCVADLEARVRDPCGARDIGRLRDHRRREVDADVLADVRRERLRKEPRPAADVEHALVAARRDRPDVARDGLGLVHVRGRDEAVDLRRELLDHVALRFLEARHAAIFA